MEGKELKNKEKQETKNTTKEEENEGNKTTAEEENQKNEKKQANKKEETKKILTAIPTYLIVLFLILGIVGGVAIKLTLFPERGIIIDNGTPVPPEEDKVNMTLLYSVDCEICLINNSIVDSFVVNGVQANVEIVEVSSEQGIGFVEKYGITSVPTAIVDSNKLDELYPAIKELMDTEFQLIDGKYVVPESQFNNSAFYPLMYLEANESCVDSADKLDIVIFDDPYSSASLYSKGSLTQTWLDFNKDVEVRFNYTPANIGNILPDYNMADVLLTSKFLTCASEQDLYLEMDIFFRGIFCNLPQNNENVLTDWEIGGCGTQTYKSTHAEKALSQIELDVAANRAGLDSEMLITCYENADEKIEESVATSAVYNIRRVPTALLDCRYIVSAEQLDAAICALDNTIEACSGPEE